MNTSDEAITIRRAQATDADALRRLAERDSTSLTDASYMLLERGGRPLAALGLDGGHVIADPFERTAHLMPLLWQAVDGGDARPGGKHSGHRAALPLLLPG